MSSVAHTEVRKRVPAFDGLRGLAIILVLLSHGWTLWPTGQLKSIRPLDGLFWSGNLAVTVFFVVGGFVVTGSLLAEWEHAGKLNPFSFYLRRFIRLGVQLYPLVLVILIVSFLDKADPNSGSTTRESLLSIGTYSWNWYLMNHPLSARSDLGHLWYLSVEQQFYVGLALMIAIFGKYKRRIAIGLGVLIVLTAVWRFHVFNVEGWWRASLRTTTRMDGLLLGSLAAMTISHLTAIRRYAVAFLWVSSVCMIALVLASTEIDQYQYLHAQGLAFDLAVAVFVVAAYYAHNSESRVMRFMTWPWLRAIGGASLAIYLWHYPLFWAVARHTSTWYWFARSLLSFALLTVVVLAAHRFIEQPTKRWLNRSRTSESPASAIESEGRSKLSAPTS
jgi:peptidoglycan/LPS O-acetylase OafA/YrhL